jgi:hypothetical protein
MKSLTTAGTRRRSSVLLVPVAFTTDSRRVCGCFCFAAVSVFMPESYSEKFMRCPWFKVTAFS